MQAIWDRVERPRTGGTGHRGGQADARLVEAYEAMCDEDLAAAHITLFGGVFDLDGSGWRCSGCPSTRCTPGTSRWRSTRRRGSRRTPSTCSSTALAGRMGWMAKPPGAELVGHASRRRPRPRVHAGRNPGDRCRWRAACGSARRRHPHAGGGTVATLFGRLDDSNADGVDASGAKVTVGDLRAVFPGF